MRRLVVLLVATAFLLGTSLMVHWLSIKASTSSREVCMDLANKTSLACKDTARYCLNIEKADKAECQALLDEILKVKPTECKPCQKPIKLEPKTEPKSEPKPLQLEDF